MQNIFQNLKISINSVIYEQVADMLSDKAITVDTQREVLQ